MSKQPDELATEVTIAWLQASADCKALPNPAFIKQFWEDMFKTISTAYKLIE